MAEADLTHRGQCIGGPWDGQVLKTTGGNPAGPAWLYVGDGKYEWRDSAWHWHADS